MKWNGIWSSALWALAALACALCSARGEAGQLTTFVLDVPNSIITVTGTLSSGDFSRPIKSQTPGSLLTTLSGTIEADVAVGVSLALTGGSIVTPVLQPGDFLPGGAPADLAGRVVNILPQINAYGAFRNDLLDFTSSEMPLDGAGHFDAGPVATHFLMGQFDYSIDTILSNSWNTAGQTLFNEVGSLGQLTAVGPWFRLSLPLVSTLVLSDSGFTMSLDIEGRIVAYARVPEPSAIAMAIMGAFTLAGFALRRNMA